MANLKQDNVKDTVTNINNQWDELSQAGNASKQNIINYLGSLDVKKKAEDSAPKQEYAKLSKEIESSIQATLITVKEFPDNLTANGSNISKITEKFNKHEENSKVITDDNHQGSYLLVEARYNKEKKLFEQNIEELTPSNIKTKFTHKITPVKKHITDTKSIKSSYITNKTNIENLLRKQKSELETLNIQFNLVIAKIKKRKENLNTSSVDIHNLVEKLKFKLPKEILDLIKQTLKFAQKDPITILDKLHELTENSNNDFSLKMQPESEIKGKNSVPVPDDEVKKKDETNYTNNDNDLLIDLCQTIKKHIQWAATNSLLNIEKLYPSHSNSSREVLEKLLKELEEHTQNIKQKYQNCQSNVSSENLMVQPTSFYNSCIHALDYIAKRNLNSLLNKQEITKVLLTKFNKKRDKQTHWNEYNKSQSKTHKHVTVYTRKPEFAIEL